MSGEDSSIKYPYKRLEPSINKFIKILNIDLDRLHKHQNNIRKFKKSHDLDSLDKEQVNASRTCQQLKSNIRQLEQTRCRLENSAALEKFDEKTSDIRMQAITSVLDFLDHYGNIDSDLNADLKLLPDSPDSGSPEEEKEQQIQLIASKEEEEHAQQSWNDLQESQQEQIDEIESHVETASSNVESGMKSLSKAVKLKYAMYPVAGMLVGGCVGGPVGLIAGAKIGAAAAVTGGIAGYTGGRLLKKKQAENPESESTSENTSPVKLDSPTKPYIEELGGT